MADENKLLSKVTDIRLTIHDILRYAYGGFLAYLVAAIVWPVGTKNVIEILGTTISVLTAYALGGAIYIGYRPIIGEIFNHLHEWVHGWFNKKFIKNGYGYTCRTLLLTNRYGVSFIQAPEAFRTIRDCNKFDQKRQERYHKQHSELHALNVTSVVLIFSAVMVWAKPVAEPKLSPWVLLVLGIFALISSFVGEILLCRQECKCVLEINSKDIERILEQGEFIKKKDNKKLTYSAG